MKMIMEISSNVFKIRLKSKQNSRDLRERLPALIRISNVQKSSTKNRVKIIPTILHRRIV